MVSPMRLESHVSNVCLRPTKTLSICFSDVQAKNIVSQGIRLRDVHLDVYHGFAVLSAGQSLWRDLGLSGLFTLG